MAEAVVVASLLIMCIDSPLTTYRDVRVAKDAHAVMFTSTCMPVGSLVFLLDTPLGSTSKTFFMLSLAHSHFLYNDPTHFFLVNFQLKVTSIYFLSCRRHVATSVPRCAIGLQLQLRELHCKFHTCVRPSHFKDPCSLANGYSYP